MGKWTGRKPWLVTAMDAATAGYMYARSRRANRLKPGSGTGRARGRRVRGATRSSGVTTQTDNRKQYSRRNAPIRLKRKMRRMRRRFVSSLMKLVGTRTIFVNYQYDSTAAIGTQIFDTAVLYGYGPSTTLAAYSRGYNDLNSIVANDTLLNNTVNDPSLRLSGGDVKVYMDTGVIDMTIQNLSSIEQLEGPITTGVELDIYEFTCNGKFQRSLAADGGGGFTIHNYYVNRAADQATQGAGLTQIDPFDRGVTPFEMGIQNKEMGLRVVKKTKYFIPYGDVVTYQIRDSRNHGFSTRKVINDQPVCMPFAKGVIIVCKVLPQYADAIAPNLQIGCSRKYKYKIFSSHANRGGIL